MGRARTKSSDTVEKLVRDNGVLFALAPGARILKLQFGAKIALHNIYYEAFALKTAIFCAFGGKTMEKWRNLMDCDNEYG